MTKWSVRSGLNRNTASPTVERLMFAAPTDMDSASDRTSADIPPIKIRLAVNGLVRSFGAEGAFDFIGADMLQSTFLYVNFRIQKNLL